MEIDCLLGDGGLESGEKLLALEIKSGKTFNEEMTDGLKRWQQLYTEASTRILIYTGSQKTSFQGIKLLPWEEVTSL